MRKVEKRQRLFELASTQGGYFTAPQAHATGYTPRSLVYHVAAGYFERVTRGFYRLREFPSLPHEDVIGAWVKVGEDRAVVSHETALVLYELSTVRPRKIDLTVPREARPPGNRKRLPAVRIHTTTRPFRPGDLVQRFGVRITSPSRTIADSAEVGTDPDHVVQAVIEGIQRGLVAEDDLQRVTRDRSARVRRLIGRATEEAMHGAPVR